MDAIKVEPDSDIEMYSLCDIKDEEALGYSSVKSEGKQSGLGLLPLVR
jgi:hypothetical protein